MFVRDLLETKEPVYKLTYEKIQVGNDQKKAQSGRERAFSSGELISVIRTKVI